MPEAEEIIRILTASAPMWNGSKFDEIIKTLPVCSACVRRIRNKKNRGLRKCKKQEMIRCCLLDREHDARRWPVLRDAKRMLRRMGITTSAVTDMT